MRYIINTKTKTIMPRNVSLHKIEDLAITECKNEILLQTRINTELHITVENDKTIIKFPFGNNFDIIGGRIIIYEKL